MKFKKGDIVEHKRSGDIGCVIGPAPFSTPATPLYEVDFPTWGICECREDVIELVSDLSAIISLPKGKAPLSEGSWTIDEYGGIITTKKECDCGGFKTYQSMDPAYHAKWCKSHGNP